MNFWDLPTQTLTLVAGTNDNVRAQGAVTLTGTVGAGFSITGFEAAYDATLNPVPSPMPIVLRNNSGQTLTLKNGGITSGTKNRITTSTGADVTVTNGQVASLAYDNVNLVWIIVNVF